METVECPQCGNTVALDKAKTAKVGEKDYKFCSSTCAEAFEEASRKKGV